MNQIINDHNTPIKIVSLLLQGYFSKEEIVEKLGISNAGFYKSLSKLRKAGFDISSSKLVYRIRGFNDRLKLDDADRSIIAYMMSLGDLALPDYKFGVFKNFIRRMMFFGDEEDYNIIEKRAHFFKKVNLASEYKEKISKLKECIAKGKEIKIILHTGRQMMIEPKKIDWERERIYLCYINRDKNMQFEPDEDKENSMRIERVSKVIELGEEEYVPSNDEVIFELYGKLAKSYLLKREERIIYANKQEGALTIANGQKDKEALFKRLFRYDTFCRVCGPKKDVIRFNQMIHKSLSNIDAAPDPNPFGHGPSEEIEYLVEE